ncbi:hypothetical protein COA01_15570 [Bacillus cereus]|uniref:hypothetical protein n=1 Tax=Bacillus cereus TaxID=1396 RepID=UPI000C0306E9|nr:hypothetical protein [Bacillus cereus]PGP20957.1 hypothetical protein COA01_15570 [Bacillus cereus]
MKMFGIETSKIKEVIPTELPVINDYSIDYGYIDREMDLHHIEFQTVFDKDDVYRFNMYQALLKQLYKKKGVKKVITYIIFHGNVEPSREKVEAMSLVEDGSQSFTPNVIFLRDEKSLEECKKVWENVKNSKKIELESEELAMIIYNMFGETKKTFAQSVEELINFSEELKSVEQQKMLVGCVMALSNKFLKKEEFEKLEGMLFGMKLIEKFESDLLIQKAVRGLSNGKSEDDVQDILELNDEQMEEAKKIYNKLKKAF